MAENELGGPFADHHTEVEPVIQHLQLPEGIVGHLCWTLRYAASLSEAQPDWYWSMQGLRAVLPK